jgi:hypothetical protein
MKKTNSTAAIPPMTQVVVENSASRTARLIFKDNGG